MVAVLLSIMVSTHVMAQLGQGWSDYYGCSQGYGMEQGMIVPGYDL